MMRMGRYADRLRSLGTLVVAAACLPTLLALATLLVLHWQGESAMRHELEQRASLIAAALAEGSEYGLISGNPAALDRSMRELRAREPAIASIDVLDGTRHAFVSLAGPADPGDGVSVELPVRSSVPDIDFFDHPTPHVSLPDEVQPTFRLGPVVGYVRVRMSSAPMAAARTHDLLRDMLAVTLAGLAGVAVVAWLGGRMNMALGELAGALRAMVKGRYDAAETPRAGGSLGRAQQALLALSEELASQARERSAALSRARERPGATPAGPITVAPPVPGRTRPRHDGVARRVIGRVDAGLSALRLAAYGSTRLAEIARSESDRLRAHETALRVLGIAEQVNTAGSAVLDPLRWDLVDGVGLDGALEELLHGCALAHPTCTFSFSRDTDFRDVDARQGLGLHRTLQDAITHLVAYSDASEASVRLERSQDPPEVHAVISSNGEDEGSSASAARLAQIRDGLSIYGGRLEIRDASAEGTTVVLSLPVRRPS